MLGSIKNIKMLGFQLVIEKRILDLRLSEMEKAKGVKRIDFLMERNMFVGLASVGDEWERWELLVS